MRATFRGLFRRGGTAIYECSCEHDGQTYNLFLDDGNRTPLLTTRCLSKELNGAWGILRILDRPGHDGRRPGKAVVTQYTMNHPSSRPLKQTIISTRLLPRSRIEVLYTVAVQKHRHILPSSLSLCCCPSALCSMQLSTLFTGSLCKAQLLVVLANTVSAVFWIEYAISEER